MGAEFTVGQTLGASLPPEPPQGSIVTRGAGSDLVVAVRFDSDDQGWKALDSGHDPDAWLSWRGVIADGPVTLVHIGTAPEPEAAA